MTHTIDTNGSEMMEQAHFTATTYLIKAIDAIDGMLGKGFAREHPN